MRGAAWRKLRKPIPPGIGILIGMSRLPAIFTTHPASVGETYGEHLATASGFGFRLIGAGLACLLHGLLPWTFTSTGSRAVRELHERMVTHRRRQ